MVMRLESSEGTSVERDGSCSWAGDGGSECPRAFSLFMWPLQHGDFSMVAQVPKGVYLKRGCQVDGIDFHGLDLDIT